MFKSKKSKRRWVVVSHHLLWIDRIRCSTEETANKRATKERKNPFVLKVNILHLNF